MATQGKLHCGLQNVEADTAVAPAAAALCLLTGGLDAFFYRTARKHTCIQQQQ